VPYNPAVISARPQIAQAQRFNPDSVNDLVNANKVYKGLGPITASESTGESNYHALQVWVNRRFSNRLAFQAAYTWSHAITNVPLTSFTNATTDPFNYNLDHGEADLGRRQMFVANAVYVMPSFKSRGAFVSNILGDWQVNTIVSLLDGTPIYVISGADTAGLGSAGTQRPDLVPGQPIYLKSGNKLQYLNPKAFALPGVGRFGTLGRGAVVGPGVSNVDFSINKNWRVRERYGLQFRAEMFNFFNHVNLTGVTNGLSFGNISDPLVPGGDPCNGKGVRSDGKLSTCGAAAGNFGSLTGNRGPREIQFGLKFTF